MDQRILVVEQDKDWQAILGYIFRKYSQLDFVICDSFKQGADALDRASAEGCPFAAVLTQSRLPDESGFTLAGICGDRVPVYIFTANVEKVHTGWGEDLTSLGVRKLLHKPMEFAEIRAFIRAVEEAA